MESSKVVLVVDDNPTVTKFVARVLRPMAYRVEAAADGVEALKRVVHGPVDLILLDLVMPRMNGVQFCKSLEQKKLAENAHIVLLSSAEEDIIQRVLKVTRAVDILRKPVKAKPLREIVKKYLPSDQRIAKPVSLDVEMEAEVTSDDTISSHHELTSILRDRLDSAVTAGLADKLDEILKANTREQVLDLIVEALTLAVSDELMGRMVKLVRSTSGEKF